MFGARTLKDGTVEAERVERPDGKRKFDVTTFPDGTVKIGRVESPSGQKRSDVTTLPDGTEKVPTEIPLRIKSSLAAGFLADGEFTQADTLDLLEMAHTRKHVYVTDRAWAIAALKGVACASA